MQAKFPRPDFQMEPIKSDLAIVFENSDEFFLKKRLKFQKMDFPKSISAFLQKNIAKQITQGKSKHHVSLNKNKISTSKSEG